MQTILSHIVQKRFSNINEDIATDALAYIFRSSENMQKGIMRVLRGIAPEIPMLRFETQKSEDNMRPDMWGYDDFNPRVFIENKFWAGLTDKQPVSYLEQLAKYPQPTVLLFVVPEAREHVMWRELSRRLTDAGIMAKDKEALSGLFACVASTDTGPIIALTSWTKLLAGLALIIADDPLIRNDLAQLQALCEAADIDAFVPISPGDVTNQRMPAFILQLNAIVQASVDLAVTGKILDVNGFKAQASWDRIGRYVKFAFDNGPGVWIGVNFELWKKYGETPLWMVFSKGDWGQALQSKALLEPWAARKNKLIAFQDEKLAIALNLELGEDKDHVSMRMVDLYRDIGNALCPGWEARQEA